MLEKQVQDLKYQLDDDQRQYESALNGIDDLGAPGIRDPQGTHNFVLYGPAYQGNLTADSANLTGVVYLPYGGAIGVFAAAVGVAAARRRWPFLNGRNASSRGLQS